MHLTQEKETLLITLYARALDSHADRPLLGDKTAAELLPRIDYDFRKAKVSTGDRFALLVRAKQLDFWTAEFVAEHPTCTVLHLACGLDSRAIRIAPPSTVRWFDVDYPEVIALRRRLYPERAGVTMIGTSVTDPHWLEQIPNDLPVLVVAEGLTPYLTESEVRDLLMRLTARFSSGQMAFDVINRMSVKAGKYKRVLRSTGATLTWGLDDLAEIERWEPRLKRLSETSIVTLLRDAPIPLSLRLLCRFMNLFPALRNLMRLVQYRFD